MSRADVSETQVLPAVTVLNATGAEIMHGPCSDYTRNEQLVSH
jgi:hypothetical protein